MMKMKYPVMAMLFMFFACNLFSQEVQDPNLLYKSLETRYKKSNEHIEHPKKKLKSATWVKRGDLLVEIYNVDQQFLGTGMGTDQLVLLYKEPKQKRSEMVNDMAMTVYEYERKEVYVSNNVVQDWKITQMVTEDPLIKAYDAYQQAIALDESGKTREKITKNLKDLKLAIEKEAGLAFKRKNFEKSMKYFEYAIMINQMVPGDEMAIDTASIYNAGLAASNGENYKKAAEYFEKAKQYKYGGVNLYLLLKNAYVEMGDSSKILPLLKEGFDEYPENKDIVVELINYYLNSGQQSEALEYLKIAKENDPSNATYHFAEGTLYDRMGEFDKTVEAYKKAIELNPEWFDPYYNMGVIYYNNAVEIFDVASQIPPRETKRYDEEMKRGNDELANALPYMEKALEIAEEEYRENAADVATYRGTLETLKTIYFRLRNRSDEYQQKLEAVESKLQELGS
jgi:tetratricopeptide (TPR) repeat protein